MTKGVSITVHPPLLVSQADVEVLSQFNEVIVENWVQLFHLTSNPRWERDPSVPKSTYYRLMTANPPNIEVVSNSIQAYRKMSPIEFARQLQAEQRRVSRDIAQAQKRASES